MITTEALMPRHSSRLSRLVSRGWKSPTANTWLSLFSRSVSLVLVLPLVLRHFPTADVSVWFVFSAVLAVQSVLGFGFSPSFARLLSYARAGGVVEDMGDLRDGRAIGREGGTNWDSVDRLFSCMRRVFAGLGIVSLVLLGILGTAAVWRPISHTGHRADVWLAWAVVVVGASSSFWTLAYTSYLQGMDYLAQWRRWETMMSLGTIFTSFIVLLCGGRLLALVIANQIWVLVGMLAYRQLCRRMNPDRFPGFGRRNWERPVFSVVWSSAWKSGITNVLTYGLIQSTGIICAQFCSDRDTATYNFTLRLISVAGQVVQAPFLTKLPELARLRAAGRLENQRHLIFRGMKMVHWSSVACGLGGCLILPVALRAISSKSVHFDVLLWVLFVTNLFWERHTGMLQQIRNLTNRPMEHWGMVGYFGTNVVLMMLLGPLIGLYAMPLAMLGTQLLFSLWFSGAVTYRLIGETAFSFERQVSLAPFSVLVAVNLVAIHVIAPS